MKTSRDPHLLPTQLQRVLTGSSHLFIGYGFADWSFRVLFRGLVTSTEAALRRISVAVMLPPLLTDGPDSHRPRPREYLEEYFNKVHVRSYWGTAREFAAELRQRWEEFSVGN